MDVSKIPVRELLPHDPPMVLLDRVLTCDKTSLVAEVTIRPDSLLCGEDGVPAWVGIEYMAQSVAAHAGAQARLSGAPPSIGYLLGTRSYKSTTGLFALGDTLTIHVETLFTDMGLGAFACRIEMNGPIATATINVYQPTDDIPEGFDSGKLSR